MNFDEVCNRLISEIGLVKNKRMAVIYYANLGDFYSLCTSYEYAENELGKGYILLYHSDRHKEMMDWFAYDGYKLKSYRISEEEYDLIRKQSIEAREKFQDFFVFFDFGEQAFRKLTINSSPDFAIRLRKPRFPSIDVLQKYKSYIEPNNTILIVPQAGAVQTFPLYFWNFAAQILGYMGFSVVFNVEPQRAHDYNGKCIFVPVSEIVAVADTCGYIFGVRTGLLDILSCSTANMVIFSPRFYKPINEVYHIANAENRIRTFFYSDKDPYFIKTQPVSFVQQYHVEENKSIYDLLSKLFNVDFNAYERKKARILNSYVCTPMLNKYCPGRKWTQINPFADAEYSNCIVNCSLALKIYNIYPERYRFDYEVYQNERNIMTLRDLHSNSLVYPLRQSGEYYVKVTITALETFDQEFFETDRMSYTALIPSCMEELPLCEDFYTYILALKNLSSQITIFISSRDAHTFFRKTKSTEVLRVLSLLGLETDFESTCRYSFIGVIDEGNVSKELLASDQTLTYECEIGNNKILITSSGHNATHTDKTPIAIEINGKNYAVNRRGLNFVIWNKQTNKLIDSVTFDTFSDGTASRNSISESQLKGVIKQSEHNMYESLMLSLKKAYEEEALARADNIVKNRTIASMDEKIIELNKSLAFFQSEKDMLNRKLSDVISQKETLMQEKEQLTEVHENAVKTGEKIEQQNITLRAESRKQQKRMDELEEQMKQFDLEMRDLESENIFLKEKIAEMEHSRSWRVTRPFRTLIWKFHKTKN